MEENRPEAQRPENRYRPTHSPRTWRACCLVPTIAVALVLIVAFSASLLSPVTRFARSTRTAPDGETAVGNRQAFIRFGRGYFAVADKADRESERAFKMLESTVKGTGSLNQVHDAFRKAAEANAQASEEFRALEVPSSLESQSKIRKSLGLLSDAYDGRRRICEMMASWNGDVDDRELTARYRTAAEDVNRLTIEGLKYLGEAAGDNQLTREDVEKFVPPAPTSAAMLDPSPWRQ